MNSLNNLIYLIFFSVLHLTKASKPSIKTVTVNPCTFTPTTPTYVSPSSPCPTITISTSHTSCPPSLAPVPTPYQPPPSTPRAPRPVRKSATSAIKSTTKHPAPPPSLTPSLPAQPQLPSSTPQLPSQYQRCIYLSTVAINCGCGGSIGTVTKNKLTSPPKTKIAKRLVMERVGPSGRQLRYLVRRFRWGWRFEGMEGRGVRERG
ncbi:hypothetical protein H4I95_02229 [Botrytis cinerea]